MSEPPYPLLKAVSIAALVATVLLLAVILPAEYGIDPLGTGELTGLIALSKQDDLVLQDEDIALSDGVMAFELAPFESVEYKFALAQGSSLQFEWSAPIEIAYELHGEPERGPEGFAESFDKGKAATRKGTFTAPFSGRHGWYFENRQFERIQVKLKVGGFFTESYRFMGGFVEEGALDPETRDAPSSQ